VVFTVFTFLCRNSLKLSEVENTALRGKVAALVKLDYSPWRIAKQLRINPNTAKKWKMQCQKNEKRFLSGPHYDHKGN
jgi:hypothetical protein